jgi:hypothetical protein
MPITTIRAALILAVWLTGMAATASAQAQGGSLKVALTGEQCGAPVETGATGTADLTYDPASRSISWQVTYGGLSSAATLAHIHGPAGPGKNGPVMIWLSKQGTPPANPIVGQAVLTPEQAQQFAAGELYVNLHTQAHPACELRGQIVPPKS